jgi:hypothetical protein
MMRPEGRPNPDRSAEALAARLCALPRPPVPTDLEARLLANIRTELPIPRRRWGGWVGVAGALAAVCLLAVLTWLGRDGKDPVPAPGTNPPMHQVTPRPPDNSDRIAAWRETRRVLDGAEMAASTWPLQETSPIRVSTSIPPDLLQ